jgi:hypothetical protein
MQDNHQHSATARRCWVDGHRICFELLDERIVSFPADKYPLLAAASAAQLAEVTLRVQGRALRWESVDEDIWIEDVLFGRFPRGRQKVA